MIPQIKPQVAERVLTLGLLVASFCTLGAAPLSKPVGFSTIDALGDNGTTGGGDLPPIVVRNALELQTAVEHRDIKDKAARDRTPRVVLIANDIDLGELKNTTGGTQIKDVGVVRIGSHTTLYAAGAGATIRHGTLEVHGKHNVILCNLAFRDLWEVDPTGNYDKLGWDYLRITREGDVYSHHVWVDHCDFGKVYDGQLDIVHGSDLVTVSWCRFAGDERGPQKKVTLVGHSSNNSKEDRGRLNVTFHHNWYESIDDRAPRARFGNVHFFNNYVNGATHATMSVMGATSLVERCYYNDVQIATSFSHADDTVAKSRGGTVSLVDCINANPRALPRMTNPSVQFEREQNFKSNVERDKLEFSATANLKWTDRTRLPYDYVFDSVADVPQIVKQSAGLGKGNAAK